MELIDLSDNLSSSVVIDLGEESDDVIEICEIHDCKNDGQYDSIFKESKMLGEFIEKCFDLESTKGMARVINRSLIPAYHSTSQIYRDSDVFTTIMSRSIRKLDSDPDHKFSHVKELCDEMKRTSQKFEARLKLLNKPKYPKRKKKIKYPTRKKQKLNQIDNIILSDDSNGFEVPIINLDENASHATITGVPLENCNRLNQEVAFIEVDFDNVIQEPGSTNEVNVNVKKDSPTSSTDLGKENINENNSSQYTLKSETKNTESVVNSTEAHINNKKQNSNLQATAKLLIQDNNLKPLGEQSNKDTPKFDTEISSTAISSTVHGPDNCDVDVEGSQDSDIIVLEQDEKELVTTTQKDNVEENNVNADDVVCSNRKLSTIPVLANDTCRKSIDGTEDKDLIVLDKDDTHKLTKELCGGNVVENKNNKANNISSKVPALTDCKNGKSITGSVINDLIVLDEDEENGIVTTTVAVNKDTKLKSNVNSVSVEERKCNSISKELRNNNLITIDNEDDSEKNACNNNLSIPNSSPVNGDNKLLVPHKAIVFEGTTEDMLMMKIKRIEFEISAYKARITALEEEEVNDDSMWSPYIQCEKYKAKIVKLYEELCKLTGERAVKRREVRLMAANTRSQLCVDKLEGLINSNIGHDGLPHFPDFQDVLQCVRAANKEGQLGWNRNEVLREANTLFTYCGRALQESRKRREWRDMLSLVKSELIEDPADSDPNLMARLQANKQTAVKKEKDLLDRYTEISYLPPRTECTNENDSYHSDSENETENEVEQEITPIQNTANNITSQHCHNTSVTDQCTADKYKAMEVISQNLVNAVLNKITANPNSLTETHGVEDTSKFVTYGSHVIRKRCTPIKLDDDDDGRRAFMNSSTGRPEVLSNIDPKNILNHNFNLITKVVLQRIPLPDSLDVKNIVCTDSHYGKKGDTNTNETDNKMHILNKVKKEPVDIQEDLNKLGNNFTATVIDIEDPFLVVEISSDSEDEDDDFTNVPGSVCDNNYVTLF